MSIRFSNCCKNCALLLSTLFIIACQPPAPIDNQQPDEVVEQADSPITFDADSVTMASDYILNIKTSRYQPSLGLQGVIEPIKQSRFVAARNVIVQKVLVTEGQWVEEGMPLLIVDRQSTTDKKTASSNADNSDEKITTENKGKVNNGTDTAIDAEDNKTTTANASIPTGNESALAGDDVASKVVSQKNIDNKAGSKNVEGSQDQASDSASQEQSKSLVQPIVVRASFSGRVDKLYVKPTEQVAARTPLLRLSDDKNLRFIATLPMETEPQLSVGQTVNFTAKGLSEEFAGQVSKLVASNQPDKLWVYVDVVKNEASRDKLKPGMLVTGRVNYGQIEVGTILPEHGIHDVDLSVLKQPPYQSLMPLTANVWIIKQDQRLTLQPVEVIKYDPSTKQYLVAGISNDSLICLADLPKESIGKKVIIS